MLTINTNLASLIVQSNLNQSTNALNRAIERMTTGFKINGAKDNAANYGISTQMSTKISAYEVAEDNAAMGLDLVSTASGALDQISDRLARLRALQEQANNGTYGEDSLKAINAEVNALVDEIDRVYNTTEYNGIKLFSAESGKFLQKINKRATSAMVSVSSISDGATISSGTYSVSTAEELAKLNKLNIHGGEFVLANDINLAGYSNWQTINLGNGCFDGNGYVISNATVTSCNDKENELAFFNNSSGIKNIGLENINVSTNKGVDFMAGLCAYTWSDITNCYVTGTVCRTLGDSNGYGVGGLIGQLNGGNISNCFFEGSIICLLDDVHNSITVGGLLGDNDTTDVLITNSYVNANISAEHAYGVGKVVGNEPDFLLEDYIAEENDEKNLVFQVGINSSTHSMISVNTSFEVTNLSTLRNIGLGGNYLNQLDDLISKVSAKQTELGAVQNRLESALEEINTHYENLVSSRSTLRDADVAEESSAYIRNQILQQASATLLATANQTPAIALQLL